ncbi:fibrinogen-binding protein [Neorhizobium sp. P12A]|uniref:fibrinogen-binding protein n=1 Tax=Neorhizobium sp. P12A TaxID=2268027 RepID=UPI0011EC5AEC|nr:fibrinogen-binding protein [Neorhizobium sp. P12A]KAA0697446.1 fibrinogen-binding protein [Neorhizobium sp. P12A]
MPDLDIANVSAEDDLRVGALADGLATSAVNGTHSDDGSVAVAGVANQTNTTNTNIISDDDKTDSNNSTDDHSGNNRNNDYDWDYTSKVINATHTDTDVDIKDNGNTSTSNSNNDLNSHNDYDWTSNKSFSNTETDIRNINKNEMDDSYNTKTTSDSHNSTNSDDDFGSLKDVANFGNLGVAGHDVTYDIGDDFSFHFNVDNILNNALGGDGNDTGFSLVQANNLADQDTAYDLKMNNSGADNYLNATGGNAHGADGVDIDSKLSWDPHTAGVGHDLTGSNVSDASAILANSGFHQELVQGANMVSNAADIAITGGNDQHDTHNG